MVTDKDTKKQKKKKHFKEKIKEIKENKKGKEEQHKEFRMLTRKSRLSGKVKFVLSMLSHYKFRQHLLNKAKEYGCKVIECTEEYTSQCCGKCGYLSKTYNKREKECEHCRFKINRDVNGARNILIKNYKLVCKLKLK